MGNFVPRVTSELKRFVDMAFGATRIDVAARLVASEYPNCPAALFAKGTERFEVISTAKLASQQAH